MRSLATTIVGLGIVTALFLAIMSMFYLQQVPSKADLKRLETSLRQEYGLYLASSAPLDLDFIQPGEEGGRLGVDVVFTLRPDLTRRPATVSLYVDRIGESILDHPDWRGKVGEVRVSHSPPLNLSRTFRAPRKATAP